MTAQTPIATIASIRAAWEAEVARTNRIVGGPRNQAGYAECLAISRTQIGAAKTWQRAILFDLLCENLPAEYAEAVRDIETIKRCDGNQTEYDALYVAESLLAFARDKYAVAEART